MTGSASESDPGRTKHYHLTADRVHILVLNAAQRARSKTGTDHDCIDGYLSEVASREDIWPTFDNLADVLNTCVDDGATSR